MKLRIAADGHGPIRAEISAFVPGQVPWRVAHERTPRARARSRKRVAALTALLSGIPLPSRAQAPEGAEAVAPEGRERERSKKERWTEAEDLDGLAVMPRLGLAVSGTSFATVLLFGAGAHFFVGKGVAFGLEFDDMVLLYSEAAELEDPGIRAALPRHVMTLMPQVTWVMLPRLPLSPYLRAAVGAVFHDRSPLGAPAALGKWAAGAGAIFTVDGFWIDIGANIASQFPDARFAEIWRFGEVEPYCGFAIEPCSLRFEPRIGVGYAFGPRRRD